MTTRKTDPWALLRNLPTAAKVVLVAFAALIVLAVAGAVVGNGKQAARYSGHPITLGTTIWINHLYCQWDGSHVKIHATVHNYGSATSLAVEPIYWTAGGSHGDDVLSGQYPNVSAGTSSLVIDAGSPQGVKQGARIVKCQPHISD